MVYQPMIELLAYLRANDFKTFIVSAGGIEFMRPWVEKVYGIPPEQVVGSAVKLKFESRAGKPVLVKLPKIDLITDGLGKPVGIQMHLGRRPILAFGNSDSDLPMLQWMAAGSGAPAQRGLQVAEVTSVDSSTAALPRPPPRKSLRSPSDRQHLEASVHRWGR